MATSNSKPKDIDYFNIKTYQESLKYIHAQIPIEFKGGVSVGIVCGSGLGGISDLIQEPKFELNYKVRINNRIN
jgi:purine nucleoside phosphorylase